MHITLVRATLEHAPLICECSFRAFKNDHLNNAIFPNPTKDQEIENFIKSYRIEIIKKRLQNPGARAVVAIDTDVVDSTKVVGYALWWEITTNENDNKSSDEQSDSANGSQDDLEGSIPSPSSEERPSNMIVELYTRVHEILAEMRKNLIKSDVDKLWYLGALGVHPDYLGKGIASRLVNWGVELEETAGLPAYLESTPMAVGLYRKLGFVELGKTMILEDDEYYLTAMLKASKMS